MKEAKRFIQGGGGPLANRSFVWFHTTTCHFRTHARSPGRWPSSRALAIGIHDVMIYHDNCIGEYAGWLVDEPWASPTTRSWMYTSTDNGPH